MEKKSINSSFHSQHSSVAVSPAKAEGGKEGKCGKEGRSRKEVVEHMESLRRRQLQKQLEERQLKLNKYLQQKQEDVQKEAALRHSKSSQWFERAKSKAKPPLAYPQLVERDFNGTFRDRKEIQSIYFSKKKTGRGSSKLKHHKVDCIDPLPYIGKENSEQSGKPGEISLMELGIFTAQSDMEAFLRRFRATVEREFKGGADMDNIFDLNRMEYHLLREINLEK